jgi:DNA-binding transcriptional MerR regulator
MKQKQYTIQELSELTGFSRRTIRYYIQEGLLKPPAGRGRGGYYYDSHLNALSKIRQLQNQGLRLSTISPILKEAVTETLDKIIVRSEDKVWIRYPIADGVAFHVRRDIDINQRKKIDQLIRLADAILNTSAKGEGSNE